MSDTISTTFQADASDFTAEVKKAKDSLEALSGKTLPLMEKNMNDAFFAAQKTAKGISALQAPVKGTGTGLLQLAYFADDAQYGMKGILNNIPGIIQGLGMGAGIAGAVSIVSLAAATAWPLLKKLYSTEDTEAAIAAAKQYGTTLKDNLKQITETNAALERQAQITATQNSYAGQVARDTMAPQNISATQKEIEALQKQKAIEEQINAAKAAALAAEAKAKGQDPAAVTNDAAKAAAALAQQRLAEEIALQQKLSRLQAEEMKRLQALAGTAASFFQQNAAEIDAEIQRLQQNVAFAEAAAAQAKAEAEDKELTGKAQTNARQNAAATEAKLAKEKEALATAQAMKQASAENAALAKAQYEAAARAASEASAAAAQKALDLQGQKATAQELADLAEKERLAAQATEAATKAKATAEKAAADAKRKAAEDARAAEKQRDQKTTLTETQAELAALRAQANGQKKLADEIRARIAIAQTARQIAASTGISEEKALAIAKEKHNLQKQIDGQKTAEKSAARDGRIRLFKAGESDSTLQRGTTDTARRAQDFQRRTQSWMNTPQRVNTGTTDLAAAQLKATQDLLRVWDKALGII